MDTDKTKCKILITMHIRGSLNVNMQYCSPAQYIQAYTKLPD